MTTPSPRAIERTLSLPAYWDGAEAARDATDIWGLRRIRAIRESLSAGERLQDSDAYLEWKR